MNLPDLVREAESGKPVEITRRGESVAILLGRKEYERLSFRSPRFSEAWDQFRSGLDLAELEIDPDVVFDDTRDVSPGRNTTL
jgi:prevent-host-death family protein